MQHLVESIFGVESNQITLPIQIYIQNRFSPWIRGPRDTVESKKTEGRKSRGTVPVKENDFKKAKIVM
jgi:hypothetical protein